MRHFFFLLIVSVLISIVGVAVYKDAAVRNSQIQPPSQPLPREAYQNVRDFFVAIVKNQDPKIALQQLQEQTTTNDSLLRSCHMLTHDIGHAAYEKYKDFAAAIAYQNDICNSGYLHGVIESHFSTSADFSQAVKTVCNKYPKEKFLSWECYHGVGHGLMFYTDNDLPRSLALCDAYDTDFAKGNCANGVFMENFNSDAKMHPSKFLKPDDPFYPCQEQTPNQKGNCYFYAPEYYLHLHPNDYAGALRWCKTAELPFQQTCAANVGGNTIIQNIHNPKFAEAVCMASSPEQKIPCIEGMVGLYINHHGSLEPARTLCEQLEPHNQQTCRIVIESNSGLFTNEAKDRS
ncbi:MAG: hypothetical protein AAB581_03830 [Patescibacteria group bacterium]